MEAPLLRFTHNAEGELALTPGVHAVGRTGAGSDAIGLVDDGDASIVRFCVDRRGVWLTVAEGAGGVHVNGRPVARIAMLRLGDAVYVDGVEMLLVTGRALEPVPAEVKQAALDSAGDPRVVLRGVGGQYHGRSFTLEVPRLIGHAGEADIRIDEAGFADRHARLELSGEQILLRDLGSADGSVVNGVRVRDAILQPGDQVVFDDHHRFVIEAPARRSLHEALPTFNESGDGEFEATGGRTPLGHSARRLPWLLLAALLLAGALGALLLFGSH